MQSVFRDIHRHGLTRRPDPCRTLPSARERSGRSEGDQVKVPYVSLFYVFVVFKGVGGYEIQQGGCTVGSSMSHVFLAEILALPAHRI
jgi:hypothetical protein